MTDETVADDPGLDEDWQVYVHRYDEARAAGLAHEDAEEFAGNHQDVGLLRKLVAAGVPPWLIARIVV